MTCAPITPARLKALKPQFASVGDDVVQGYIDLAQIWAGGDWPQAQCEPVQAAMACHLMVLDGLGAGAEAGGFASGTAAFQSIKSGTVTLTRFQAEANGAGQTFADWLGSTTCGRFVWQLMRARFAGPRVAMGGIGGSCTSTYAKDWPISFREF